jgi:hypothetical protein
MMALSYMGIHATDVNPLDVSARGSCSKRRPGCQALGRTCVASWRAVQSRVGLLLNSAGSLHVLVSSLNGGLHVPPHAHSLCYENISQTNNRCNNLKKQLTEHCVMAYSTKYAPADKSCQVPTGWRHMRRGARGHRTHGYAGDHVEGTTATAQRLVAERW